MAEKLPIIYTEEDIPEQCRECPAFQFRVATNSLHSEWEESPIKSEPSFIAIGVKAALPNSDEMGKLNSGNTIGAEKREELINHWTPFLHRMIDLHNEEVERRRAKPAKKATTRRQAVSDFVREMKLCQTGPIAEYDLKRVSRERDPYRGDPDDVMWTGPNHEVVRSAEGKTKVIDSHYVPTGELHQECGLEVDWVNSPVYGTLEHDYADCDESTAKKIRDQQKAREKHVREAGLATQPKKIYRS
ncbi:MAG: hypothetical protein ACREGF_00465 [Candidatus Saccharimonadales bacterium]